MITKDTIDSYIDRLPPLPQKLKMTLSLLDGGDLVKSAKIAQSDLALNAYLKKLVNKSIYGFRNEISNVSQIFGILGVSGSQQSVYNYIINLLSPEKWVLFSLNKNSFNNLQAELSANWQTILKHLGIQNKEIESAIALLPASIIISEALFSEHLNDIRLLRSAHEIDYNTILQRLTGMDLFDICVAIAHKWEMSEEIVQIIQAASGTHEIEDTQVGQLAQWMHLLLFFTLSKEEFVKADLNDFIEFQIDFVSDIYEEFIEVMGVQ